MGKYGSKFARNGYDDLDLLAELNADEVELLIEVLRPLPGHAAKLRKRLEQLPLLNMRVMIVITMMMMMMMLKRLMLLI